MNKDVIQELLKDFNPKELEEERQNQRPLTVWLSATDKARYDRIQKMSNRRFNKMIREVIQAALDVVEKKAG